MTMVVPRNATIQMELEILYNIGPRQPGSTDVELARVLYAPGEDHHRVLGGVYGILHFSAQSTYVLNYL